MKKLLAAALAACTIIGSFATVSMAEPTLLWWDSGIQNRFNGSYYYDIGYCKAYSDGTRVKVKTIIYKNSVSAPNTTIFRSGTVTCWSGTIQGSGADYLESYFI